MFLTFVGYNPTPARDAAAQVLFDSHPADLAEIMEYAWENRDRVAMMLAPGPVAPPIARARFGNRALLAFTLGRRQFAWPHLSYAYMIENTRVVEIARKLLSEVLHGERIGVLPANSRRWFEATEALFYRNGSPVGLAPSPSEIRSDQAATRRNAYFRMFGMELNHGHVSGQPYPYQQAQAANSDFVRILEELLRQAWIGFENLTSTTGPNPTDDNAIADLARQLQDMLQARRINENLAREEFEAVAMMSWFHLALSVQNSPLLAPFAITSLTEEERLGQLGARAGIPAHAKAGSFLSLAVPLSTLLRGIELGDLTTPATANQAYLPGFAPATAIGQIITHWSNATGRKLKKTPLDVAVPAVTNGNALALTS